MKDSRCEGCKNGRWKDGTCILHRDEPQEHVLFEGSLGELEELSMVEDAMLELRGANGILRIDLSEEELRKMLFQNKEAK
jgi:hypothetical protein